MATLEAPTPGAPHEESFRHSMNIVSTIPDPRGRSDSPQSSGAESSSPTHHPDLNTEVATLSNKLIKAINHQTNLDDSLADARHELDHAKDRVRMLEASNSEYLESLSKGELVYRADFDVEMSRLQADLEEERALRLVADKEKRKIELELETLTTALFEEANQMVAAARREKDFTERKNDQLKSQLSNMETLLASQQEQLTELKSVLQRNSDRDDLDTSTNVSTAPTTPSMANSEHWGEVLKALHFSPNSPGLGDVPPSYPTSFTHLLQPVLRTDLNAYEDFTSLLRLSHSAVWSRASSGSYGGLNVKGLGSISQSTVHGSTPSNNSTSISSSVGSLPSYPATPSTAANSASKDATQPTPPLKETKFYKRVLVEDVEPTLRLDTAPGLSWLARRTVLTSMSEGSLVVEPIPGTPTRYSPSCALCNESRQGEEYTRRHRFRTSESDSAQRYPLCNYCLGRVRATCDFLGFLRMVKDGHWRAEGVEGERSAWEESVRLREGMFWARVGGGVVPTFVQTKDSPRTSSTEDRASDDIFDPPQKRTSMGKSELSSLSTENRVSFSEEEFMPRDLDAENLQRDAKHNRTSKAATITQASMAESTPPAGEGDARLSITVPGAFD